MAKRKYVKKQAGAAEKSKRSAAAFPYLVLAAALLVLIAALFFALRGCRKDVQQEIAPASSVKGYYSSQQTLHGGCDLNDVSIYDVDVSQEKNDIVISMQFSYNSASTQGNTAITNLVPTYSLEMLPQPYRLALTLENVTNWTFTGKTSWLEHALLQGVFVAPPTYESADNPTVIFHLTSDAAYKVEEDGGTLKIHLRKVDTPQTQRYYVLLNGLSEYASYSAVRALSLTPTLCTNSEHTLLISRGFETQQEAEALIADIEPVVRDYLPGKTAFIQNLAPEALPSFPPQLESEEIAAMPVICKDGQPQSAEPLEVNATALCVSPQQDALVCCSPVYTLDMASGETIYSEILYLSDETDAYQKLTQQEFSSILYAQFSHDGRYIAALDYNSDSNATTLFCFDRQTDSAIDFPQDAFGTFVYDFIFDCDSENIYAVTLESDGSIVVRKCGIAARQSSILFSLNASVGMLAADDTSLYFADTDEAGQNAVVYQTRDDGASRQRICEASRFLVSTDGRFLAAAQEDGLHILRLADAQQIAHLPDVQVSDFHFSPDGDRLVCVAQSQTPQNDKYPGDVYLWDAAQNAFAYQFSTDCIDVLFSVKKDCLLLNDTYYTQISSVPVVYRVDLSQETVSAR